MPLDRCGKCGFHSVMARLFSWNDNGTITMRNFPDMRTVVIESDFIDDLFSRVEKRMGVSLRHIVFEAQVNASIRAVDTQLSRPLFRQGRRGSFKHIGAWVNSRIPVWSGMGYTRTLLYEPGKRYEAVVANPFNKELLGAIILGSFISLEKRPFTHRWMEVKGHDVLVLESADARPDVSERLDIGFPPARPGNLRLERCRSCGTPVELSYLTWNEEQGIILDSRRGVRVTFLDGYVPTLVIRELVTEVGEDLYPLVIEAEKEYTKEHIRGLGIADAAPRFYSRDERDAIYERVLSHLPLYGLGNPVDFKHGNGWLRVTIENPYNDVLLAGRMAGVFEVVEGLDAEVKWESPQEAVLVCAVSPQG